jgi:hypothetical protein
MIKRLNCSPLRSAFGSARCARARKPAPDEFLALGGLPSRYGSPVLVGGGKRALPDDVRLPLELVGERRFDSGFVHLHYRT